MINPSNPVTIASNNNNISLAERFNAIFIKKLSNLFVGFEPSKEQNMYAELFVRGEMSLKQYVNATHEEINRNARNTA